MCPDRQRERGDADGGADDDPGGLDAVARVQPPDDHASQRLAANILWVTDAATVQKHATPVANRVTGQGSEAESHRGGHARDGRCNADPNSLPAVAVSD